MGKFKTYDEFEMNESAGITGYFDLEKMTKIIVSYKKYLEKTEEYEKNEKIPLCFYELSQKNKIVEKQIIRIVYLKQKPKNVDATAGMDFRSGCMYLFEKFFKSNFLKQINIIAHESTHAFLLDYAHYLHLEQGDKLRCEVRNKLNKISGIESPENDKKGFEYAYFRSGSEQAAYAEGFSYIILYLTKLFPNKKEEVKQYIRTKNINFNEIFPELDEFYKNDESEIKIIKFSEKTKTKFFKILGEFINSNENLMKPYFCIFFAKSKNNDEKINSIKKYIEDDTGINMNDVHFYEINYNEERIYSEIHRPIST